MSPVPATTQTWHWQLPRPASRAPQIIASDAPGGAGRMRRFWTSTAASIRRRTSTQSLRARSRARRFPRSWCCRCRSTSARRRKPVVAVGERVLQGADDRRGQRRGQRAAARPHARVRSSAIETALVAHPSGLARTLIVMRPDGAGRMDRAPAAAGLPGTCRAQDVLARIRNAGIAGWAARASRPRSNSTRAGQQRAHADHQRHRMRALHHRRRHA